MDVKFMSRYAWVFCVLLSGLAAGCASTQETSTLQQSVVMLNERQNVIDRRLEGTEGSSRKSSELYARVEELQMRVGQLNGKIEELDHKIDMLQRAAAAAPPPVSAAPPGNVVMEPSPPPVQQVRPQPQPQPPAPGPMASVPPRVQSVPPAAPAPVRESAPGPEKSPDAIAFEKAAQLQQSGKFEAARKEFHGLATRNPKSEIADDALFNVGECYFSEKRYQDAIETYQQVIDKYPKGSKAPNALFRQGAAFQAIGDTTAARIIYERLVEKYPGTPQAQAAEKKIKQM